MKNNKPEKVEAHLEKLRSYHEEYTEPHLKDITFIKLSALFEKRPAFSKSQ